MSTGVDRLVEQYRSPASHCTALHCTALHCTDHQALLNYTSLITKLGLAAAFSGLGNLAYS